MEKLVGDGQYVFDKKLGLLRSANFKQTIEVNSNNVTVRVPTTVSLRLVSDDEAAKLKADHAAAVAKQRESREKAQAQNALEHADDASSLPDGAVKTEMVGGNGGGPYIKVRNEKRDVVGFTIRIGSWAGHPVLGSVAPLYEAPPDQNPANASVCLAKDGYVVGGLIVNDKDGAAGMRVIFMKKAPTGPDTRVSYMSPWFGYTDEGTQHTLAGKGERVIGTFGRQGMNMDAIGLVVEPVPGAAPADPSAHPPQ